MSNAARCRARRMRLGLICWISLLPCAAIAAAEPSAEPSAEDVLKDNGLRKISSHFVLEEELQLRKSLRAIQKLKKEMLTVAKTEAAAQQRVAEKDKLIVNYIQQRRQLRQRLAKTRSAKESNQIIAFMNELADRVILMQGEKQLDEQVKQARAAASTAREAYVQALLNMRELVQRVEEKYADLSVDDQVRAALEKINSEGDKTYALGPALSFGRNVRQLKKLEDSILSESIDLRREGDLFAVSVMFNGKYTKELAVDTGASVVSLPLKMAKEVGIEPTEDDPTIQLRLADGRVVEAKLVTIDELRVGKFVVEKVKCAVMGEDLPDAAPLLGQSFLRHFTYKLDPRNAQLIMTKVDASPRRR